MTDEHYVPRTLKLSHEDEISLIDLLRVLVKRKITILAMTVLVTLAALSYALIAPPLYRAEAIFLPPSAKDIQGLQGVDVASVYHAFKRNLNSRALQRRFVEEQGLIEILTPEREPAISIEHILQDFSEILKDKSDKKEKDVLSLSIEWRDPEQAARWVNQLTKLADRVTVHQLASDLVGAVDTRIRDIENAITSKRQLAVQRREDRISKLEEALQIVQFLGINERQGVFNIVQDARATGDASGSESSQLYNRGTKVLQAEISVLRNRKSDDAFIAGLRDLQEELSSLRSVKVDEAAIRAVTVDQAAFPPSSHIKPKRKLIVVLGGVLGLMLGVFAAFFTNFLDKQRKEAAAA